MMRLAGNPGNAGNRAPVSTSDDSYYCANWLNVSAASLAACRDGKRTEATGSVAAAAEVAPCTAGGCTFCAAAAGVVGTVVVVVPVAAASDAGACADAGSAWASRWSFQRDETLNCECESAEPRPSFAVTVRTKLIMICWGLGALAAGWEVDVVAVGVAEADELVPAGSGWPPVGALEVGPAGPDEAPEAAACWIRVLEYDSFMLKPAISRGSMFKLAAAANASCTSPKKNWVARELTCVTTSLMACSSALLRLPSTETWSWPLAKMAAVEEDMPSG